MDSTLAVPYRLRDDVRQNWLIVVLLTIAVLVWGWCDVRRRGRIDPLRADAHKTDFTVYTEAGAAFFDGRDPYQVTNSRGWSYLYPPLFALVVSPLGRLDTQSQTFAWFLISIVFAGGCYVEARHWLALLIGAGGRSDALLATRDSTPFSPGGAGWGRFDVSVILLPASLVVALPTLNCLQRGQIAILQLYFLMLGFRWIVVSRDAWQWLAGGMLLAIPVVLKITPAMPVGCLLLMLAVQSLRERSGWLRTGLSTTGVVLGTGLLLFAIPASVVGWNANTLHLQAFAAKVLHQAANVRNDDFGGEVDSPRNQSLENAVYRLGLWVTYQPDIGEDGKPLAHVDRPRVGELPRVPLATQISFTINCLLVALLIAQTIGCGWTGQRSQLCLGFALAGALTLIVSPVARGHYFVMLLPLMLTAPMCLLKQGRPRSARFVAWAPVVLTALHYTFVNSLGRLGLYGLLITAWYITISVMLVAPWWKQRIASWIRTADAPTWDTTSPAPTA